MDLFISFEGAKEDVKIQWKESDLDFVNPRIQDPRIKCKTDIENPILLMALESGDLDMMKDLVRDHGVDVNEEIEWNEKQSTPLIIAMSLTVER